MTASSRPDRPAVRQPLAWLALFTLLGALLRGWHLGTAPLWADEALSLVIAQYSYFQLFFEPVDPTAGLYYSVQKLWLPAGDASWIVRLPSFLFGVLSIPAAYVLGRAMEGPRTGLWLALLIAILPEWIFYSQEARAYSLLMLLLILALGFLTLAFKGRRIAARPLLFSAVFALAALYTHLTAWFVVGPLALYALFRLAAERGVKVAALWSVVGSLLILPEVVRMVRSSLTPSFAWLQQPSPAEFLGLVSRMVGPWSGPGDPRLQSLLSGAGIDLQNAAMISTLLALALLAILIGAMIVRPDWRPVGAPRAILVTLLVIVPIAMILFGAIRPIILVRTLLPFQLGLAILSAIIASKVRAVWGFAAIALLIVPELVWSKARLHKANWTEIAMTIQREGPGAPVVFCSIGNVAAYLHAQAQLDPARRSPVALPASGGLAMLHDPNEDARWQTGVLEGLGNWHALGQTSATADVNAENLSGVDLIIFARHCSGEQREFLEGLRPSSGWKPLDLRSPFDQAQFTVYRVRS